jgi:DNA-binding NarL/FixJ family response regulator
VANELSEIFSDILIVEPEQVCRERLAREVEEHAIVTVASDFPTGRRWLDALRPRVLVANVRLGEYNGINLAVLADREHTTCIVYSSYHDESLAREAQAVGAFYELLAALPLVLPAYIQGRVPGRDRRDPAQYTERRLRGAGRRATDTEAVH